jgi:hypothetical protein
MKVESDYQSPVATGQFVWTANPTSGRVAYIDAKSFAVQTAPAGDGPTYLAAVPDPSGTSETAIVINVRSHDSTLLRHDSATGVTTTAQYPSTADANSWAISPKGRWAIAWTDATKVMNPDPTQGFQEMKVLDINPPPNVPPLLPGTVVVGYRPSELAFSSDETRAFAVTQDGITVIDLSGSAPIVTKNFPLYAPTANDLTAPDAAASDTAASDAAAPDAALPDSAVPEGATAEGAAADAAAEDSSSDASAPEDATVDAGAAEGSVIIQGSAPSGMPDVSFTTDGAYALVRQSGIPAITIVSLKDGSTTRVDLPSSPTDLALAPDGTFAVAVLRDLSTVVILPLPGIVNDPSSFRMKQIPGQTIGRAIVAEDATKQQVNVLLFTTVGNVDGMTVFTLQPTESIRNITLYAPVLAVFPTSDAKNAIVLHNLIPGPNTSAKGAYSIVPISSSLPATIVSSKAPLTAVALDPSGSRALITMSDDMAIFEVDVVQMQSRAPTPYMLASPPTAVGIAAAADMGFVAQNYTDGRITFIDLTATDAGAARTITGFELGARVVQGEGGTP